MPLGVKDEPALGQEFVGYLHGRSHVPSEVPTQVKHKTAETIVVQAGQGGEELGVSGLAKISDADITRRFVEHVDGINALDRDIAPDNGETELFLRAGTHHAKPDGTLGGPFKEFHRRGVGYDLAGVCFPVDGNDAVVGHQADVFRRPARQDADDTHRVVINGELHANARKASFEPFHRSLHVFRRRVCRVRVQLPEDLRHGLFNKVRDIDLVHILGINDVQEVVDFIARSIDDIQSVARIMVGVETADEDAEHDSDGDYQRDETRRVDFVHIAIEDSSLTV